MFLVEVLVEMTLKVIYNTSIFVFMLTGNELICSTHLFLGLLYKHCLLICK